MSAEHPAWHQALVFAFTGERRPELGVQDLPDLDFLVTCLRAEENGPAAGGAAGQLGARTYPVPADMSRGIGPAQFSATLTALRRRLRTDTQRLVVVADRSLDSEERRLIADTPPHHG